MSAHRHFSRARAAIQRTIRNLTARRTARTMAMLPDRFSAESSQRDLSEEKGLLFRREKSMRSLVVLLCLGVATAVSGLAFAPATTPHETAPKARTGAALPTQPGTAAKLDQYGDPLPP